MDGIMAINLADELQGIWAKYEVRVAVSANNREREAEMREMDAELLAAVKRYLLP